MYRRMYSTLRSFLFRLDAERAHHLTLQALRLAGGLRLTRLASRPRARPVQLMGLVFPNPLGLAAGMDKEGCCVDAFGDLGFGFVEVGTVTPRSQPGNPRPRLFRLPEHQAIINRMGFNNSGVEALVERVRRRRFRGVLGVNIGKNFDTPLERAGDDYLACMRSAWGVADYLAVNISSPNTKGLRDLQEKSALKNLLDGLRAEQLRLTESMGRYVPVAVKIAPDLDAEQLKQIAELLAETGMDGVIATNTTISRDAVAGHPRAGEAGGLSGAPVRKRSTEVIAALRQQLGSDYPIIGVGGIFSLADAREKLHAGAQLVQIYSGLVYRGPALIREILDGL